MTTTKPVKIPAIVQENRRLTPDTVALTLSGDFPPYIPGQFCFLTREQDDQKYKRAYSIASAPHEPMQLCIKAQKEASVIFTQMPAGTAVEIFMPFGHFTLPEDDTPVIMIATGTGVAPYHSMIKSLLMQGDLQREITLLVGNKTAKDCIYHDEWTALTAQQENFKYHPVISREEQPGYLQGHVQDHLANLMNKEATYLICGMNAMVEDVERRLLEKNIPKEQIQYEKYG